MTQQEQEDKFKQELIKNIRFQSSKYSMPDDNITIWLFMIYIVLSLIAFIQLI